MRKKGLPKAIPRDWFELPEAPTDCLWLALSTGHLTLIDASRHADASRFLWTRSTRGYAVHSRKGRPALYLHHLILGDRPASGFVVDHVNRDQLDNRLSNLRVVTRSQNASNVGLLSSNTSGFKGVSRVGARWRARIMVNKTRIFLGDFDHAQEAARIVDEAAIKHFGRFAFLNFPPKDNNQC